VADFEANWIKFIEARAMLSVIEMSPSASSLCQHVVYGHALSVWYMYLSL